MKPPEEVQRELVLQWLGKADDDLEAAGHLLNESGRFRGVIAFHAQQAVEKYIKAFLVYRQLEFPNTHDISKLLGIMATKDPVAAAELQGADLLTPYGAEVRHPSDAPELLPGEEIAAVEIARRTRDDLVALLKPFLSGR